MDNIKWLVENGGAAIKLRMINEGLIDKNAYDVNELANELLQIEKVKTAFTYFDKFKDFHLMTDSELGAMVHNCYEDCVEMFMPFLIRLGFKAGIPAFDEKVEYIQKLNLYLMGTPMLSGRILSLLLLDAGYYSKNIEEYAAERIDKIHKVTTAQIFDIYEEDITKVRQPSKWKNKLILKDRHSNSGEFPLPVIYDVELILYIRKYLKADALKQKIDDIIRYILHPKYQETRGDYGWHWDEGKKTYHASSSGFALPMYSDEEFAPRDNQQWSFLRKLEIISLSPVIAKSAYFNKCSDYFEQYRTERGTYIFPNAFMFPIEVRPSNSTTISESYISKKVLPTIKRNDRKSFAFEVYSTFFMAMLKNRMERTN